MSAAELVKKLRERGVEIEPDGDRLVVRPRGKVTLEMREELRAQKAEVLALLRGGRARPSPRAGVCGELVIPFGCNERFQWWTARTWDEVERRFRAARIAAGLPSNGMDS